MSKSSESTTGIKRRRSFRKVPLPVVDGNNGDAERFCNASITSTRRFLKPAQVSDSFAVLKQSMTIVLRVNLIKGSGDS
jgi:hypothetical protein